MLALPRSFFLSTMQFWSRGFLRCQTLLFARLARSPIRQLERCRLSQEENKKDSFLSFDWPVKPQTKCFLDLPRELRDQIYREIIPRRISLNERDSDREGLGDALMNLRRSFPILFVNHQVSEEALEILYAESMFSFQDEALSPDESLHILKALPPKARNQIKHLFFDVWMFEICLGYCHAGHWDRVVNYIANEMSLGSITIELPYDEVFFKDSRDEDDEWTEQGKAYWWPAARAFVNLLMSASIDTLRIIHPIPVAPEVNLENIQGVRMLRIPRYQKEDAPGEQQFEESIIRTLQGNGYRTGEHPFEELNERLVGRKPHEFVVSRDKSNDDDEVTVLLLRRQKSKSG